MITSTSSSSSSSRFRIGHVPFDHTSVPRVLTAIDRLIYSRRGGYVVTPNIDHIVLAKRDRSLRSVYEGARLSLPDGQPVAWIARLLGAGAVKRVSGSDLLDPLMAHAARQAYPVFLVGATPAVSCEAARRLQAKHPGLQVVGRDTSRWSTADTTPPDQSEVVAAIRDLSDAGEIALLTEDEEES